MGYFRNKIIDYFCQLSEIIDVGGPFNLKNLKSTLTFVAVILLAGFCHEALADNGCKIYPGPGSQYFKRRIDYHPGFKWEPVCDVGDDDSKSMCQKLNSTQVSEAEIYPNFDAKIGGDKKGVGYECKAGALGDAYSCLSQQLAYASARVSRLKEPFTYLEYELLGHDAINGPKSSVPEGEELTIDGVYTPDGSKIVSPDQWYERSRAAYEARLARLQGDCAQQGISCDNAIGYCRARIPALLEAGREALVLALTLKSLDAKLPKGASYYLPKGFEKYNCKGTPKENKDYALIWGGTDGNAGAASSAKPGDGAKTTVGDARKSSGAISIGDAGYTSDKKPAKRKTKQKAKVADSVLITSPSQVDDGPVTHPSQIQTDKAIAISDDKVGAEGGIKEGHGTNAQGNTRKVKNLDHKGPAASQNQLDYSPDGKGRMTDADYTRPVFTPRDSDGWGLSSKEAPHCSEFMGKHNYMCLGTGLDNDLISIGQNKALIESFCEKEVKKIIPSDMDDCDAMSLIGSYGKAIQKNCASVKALMAELKKPYGKRTPQDAACQLWFQKLNGVKDVPNFGDKATISSAYRDSGALGKILDNMADFVEDGADRDLGAYSVIKQSQFLYAISVNIDPANASSTKAVADKIVNSASCLNSVEKSKIRDGIGKASTEMTANSKELPIMKDKWVNALVQGAKDFQRTKQKMDGIAKLMTDKRCLGAYDKQVQRMCAGFQTSYDLAAEEYQQVANAYPLLQEELKLLPRQESPLFVRLDSAQQRILNTDEAKFNTSNRALWRYLSDSTLKPEEAYRFTTMAAQKVMDDGLKRVEDICKEGLHKEGKRAADIYPLVEGYLSCDDLKESEEIACKGRANAAWSLCRTQSGERLKEEREKLKAMLKTMAMAAGGAIAMVLTAGGASVLAAVVGIGMSSYSVATGIHDYVSHDGAKMERAARLDFENQFSDFESFEKAMDAAEGPSLAGTVAWATLDVVFVGLDVAAIGKIVKNGTQSARVLKAVKAAEALEDPVSRMKFLKELREGRVTQYGIDGRRVIDTLSEAEAKEVRDLIDRNIAKAAKKESTEAAKVAKAEAKAAKGEAKTVNAAPKAKADEVIALNDSDIEVLSEERAGKITAKELTPVNGEPPRQVWVAGGKRKTIANVDADRNVVVFNDGTELSIDKLSRMGEGDKKQIVELMGPPKRVQSEPGAEAARAVPDPGGTRKIAKQSLSAPGHDAKRVEDLEVEMEIVDGDLSDIIKTPPKERGAFGRLKNREWERRFGNDEFDLESAWTVSTKNKGEAQVGDRVTLPDGSESTIAHARRDPKTGRDWVELTNGDVVEADAVLAKPTPEGKIGKLDEGREVLVKGAERKTIKSVDEQTGMVEFTDGTTMPREKLGRIGASKNKPIVEIIDSRPAVKPKPSAEHGYRVRKLVKAGYPEAKVRNLYSDDAYELLEVTEDIETTRATAKRALARGDAKTAKALEEAAEDAEKQVAKALDGCL